MTSNFLERLKTLIENLEVIADDNSEIDEINAVSLLCDERTDEILDEEGTK